MKTRILVWDWPVRIGHWVMAITFAAAYISAESERWRMVHVVSGCTVFAIVLFRLIWGVVGSKYALFSSFLHHPMRALDYVRSLLSGKKLHYLGHNPAGGWSVLALLLCLLVICGTGLWLYTTTAGNGSVGQWHEVAANFALLLIAIHLAGVAVASVVDHENLVAAMLHGHKIGAIGQAIPHSSFRAAIVLTVWVVIFNYYWI
jgi:cytochrome b